MPHYVGGGADKAESVSSMVRGNANTADKTCAYKAVSVSSMGRE